MEKETMLGKLMLAISRETALGKVALALLNVPAEMLGTLLDLVKKMTGDKGVEICKNLKHLLRGEFEIKLPILIRWLGTTKTTATTEKFVAKDKFRLKKDGGICSYIGDNFNSWFLAGDSKIEEPLGEQELRFGILIKNSLDGSIIEEQGGETKVETTLTEMFDQMSKQSKREKGNLLTNGWWNIFYIRDINGVLRAVGVYWSGGGWSVNAYSVGSPNEWGADYQVFSRNS